MREYDLIRRLAAGFPRSPRQRNRLFECDAEVLELGRELWAITLDEFSPEEDRFTAEAPVLLGANLAVATLSDLFAAGAEPAFFLQALSLPRDVAVGFADGLMQGVRSVLDEVGCCLCGGDLGSANTWRFSGVALGRIAAVCGPLTRRLPPGPQRLWVTGCLGDANLAVLAGVPTPRFELRIGAAMAIRRWAGACIDTSGGLADALWVLHSVNPAACIRVDGAAVPLAPGVATVARSRGLPPEAALLGGAGEYELLFAAPAELPPEAFGAFEAAAATPIGRVDIEGAAGLWWVTPDGRVLHLAEPPPCPRAAADLGTHVAEVAAVARRWFGS